jgi:hypothetical protein
MAMVRRGKFYTIISLVFSEESHKSLISKAPAMGHPKIGENHLPPEEG